MLMPKRLKHRKQHRGRMRGKAYRGCELNYGDYGLKAIEPAWVTSRQLEAARRAIVRQMKRAGQLWTSVFPDKPVTAKAAETRMGSGKGDLDHYVAVVKPGRIIFEIRGVDRATAIRALELGAQKLAVPTIIVERELTKAERAERAQEVAENLAAAAEMVASEAEEEAEALAEEEAVEVASAEEETA